MTLFWSKRFMASLKSLFTGEEEARMIRCFYASCDIIEQLVFRNSSCCLLDATWHVGHFEHYVQRINRRITVEVNTPRWTAEDGRDQYQFQFQVNQLRFKIKKKILQFQLRNWN